MKSTPILSAILILTAGIVFIPSTASADEGGLLLNASNGVVFPGNPCAADRPHGGVAADPAAGRIFYSTRATPVIHVTQSVAPFTCVGSFAIAGAPANIGFRRLAWDSTGGYLWAVPDDGTARVLRITWATLTVSGTFQHPALSGNLDGLAVEKVAPFRNIATLAGTNVARFFNDAGADLGSASLQGVSAVRALATWQGAILAAAYDYTIHVHDANGNAMGRSFQPHRDYVDEFYQPARDTWGYWFDAMAIDEASYASLGQVALYTLQGESFFVCVKNCSSSSCIKNCTTTHCVQLDSEGRCKQTETRCDGVVGACAGPAVFQDRCDGVVGACAGPPVNEARSQMRVRGHSIPIDPDCPDPVGDCQTEDPCIPPTPPSTLVRVAPLDRVYVEDQATTAPHSPPLAYGESLTLRFNDPAGTAGKQLAITGPLPGLPAVLTGTGDPWALTLDLRTAAPAVQSITIVQTDLTNACRPATAMVLPLQIVKPHLVSHAQSVRVSGNLPADMIVGTSPQDAQQPLLGREVLRVAGWSGTIVLPPTAGVEASVNVAAEGLYALAEHEPVTSAPTNVAAHGRTEAASARLSRGSIDACPAPPTVCTAASPADFDVTAFATDAYAAVNVDSLAPTAVAKGDPIAGVACQAAPPACMGILTTPGSEDDPLVATVCALAPPACPAPVAIVPGGTISWSLEERWTHQGPGYAEAYANLARILIDIPPYRGEIVLGESYAAASLVGSEPLRGLPRYMDAEDDFAQGADAPATGGPLLAPGEYSGTFAAADRADSIRVQASPLEKLVVVLSPAHRVEAYASTLPTPPGSQTTPRQMSLTLFDPDGVERDRTYLTIPASGNARPSRVELNVDEEGEWSVLVERRDVGVDRSGYGLLVSLTPLVHTPHDVSPLATPTGNACSTALLLPAPAIVGWLGAAETADVWALATAPGDIVVAALKPGDDMDGADFDLQILDANCAPLATSAFRGSELIPKGTPEAARTTATGAATYVKVTRVNGIGNYALEALARAPPSPP